MLPCVRLQSADQVWARIEAAARAEPGGAVATDGDGTLWSGDVGEDLFFAFLEHGRVEPPALEGLRREAERHALSDAGGGIDIARRIWDAYARGSFPERRVCELMAWCFAGWARSEVEAFARGVVERGRLGDRLHAEAMSVVMRARAAGIHVVLVSASPTAVVAAAGERAGFGEAHVVAARPKYEADVVVADVHRPIPYADGKVTRLREHIGAGRALYAAFGDNVFDVEMLASARVAVAVRPKPRLRERAGQVAGLVELAR